MIYSIKEHELCLQGVERPHLAVERDCSQVELEVECSLFEQKIKDGCFYEIEYAKRIDQLCENYSKDDLELLKSYVSSDLFAAKGELSLLLDKYKMAQNITELKECLDACERKLSDMIIYKVLLEKAIDAKECCSVI